MLCLILYGIVDVGHYAACYLLCFSLSLLPDGVKNSKQLWTNLLLMTCNTNTPSKLG